MNEPNHQQQFSGSGDPGREQAAKLIRQRINSLQEQTAAAPQSLIEKFWAEHQYHPDKNAAWRQFYESLDENQRQQLWQEYHARATSLPGSQTQAAAAQTPAPMAQPPVEAKSLTLQDKLRRAQIKKKAKFHLKPLVTGLVVFFGILFLNYNQFVVAKIRQYVSPGASISSPIIIDPSLKVNVGDEPKIIIPKINVEVPVVYDVKTYDENKIQKALERGVVHYGQTPLPGEPGNNVIVGHSSNNFFNSGKYKFAFVLLEKLDIDDTFILHYEGTRYIYRVYKKVVVKPDDFSIIRATDVPTTTLITCTPPGTSWRRLAIMAEQISPKPTTAKPVKSKGTVPDSADVVPGNAPSFFQRVRDFIL